METQTVLVTGGSGFLGGWCLVELLRRGYRVRTTVRDLAREAEVRAALAPRGGRRRSPHRLRRRPEGRRGLAAGGRGLRLRPPRRLALPAAAAEGPRRADRAGARGDPAGARGQPRRRRRARRRHLLGRGDHGAATSRPPGRSPRQNWSDPDNPNLSPYARSKTIAERAAWDLVRERGAQPRSWPRSTPARSSARCSARTTPTRCR